MKRLFLLSLLCTAMACGGSSFVIPEPVGGGTEQGGGEEPEKPDGSEEPEKPDTPDRPNEPDAPEPPEAPDGPVAEGLPDWPLIVQGAGTLVADGADAATYALITKQGYNQEAPDASGAHAGEPFRHIRQSFDSELKRWVFDFHIHVENDDDRGNPHKTDRQRNEIKTDGHSPASMVAQRGETLLMRWKFRLPEGMRTTSKFCHVHQLKGIDNQAGTADVSMPLITFTARMLSNGARQLQVIHVPPTEQGAGNDYLARVDLSDFLGEWVAVTERVRFDYDGSYSLRIVRISDGRELLHVDNRTLDLWRTGAAGLRPKWGIYRSIGEAGSLKGELRDETLRFADFEIEKP